MKYLIPVVFLAINMCSLGMVSAGEQSTKPENYKTIRADILATITSINEIRLIMINSELKGSNAAGGTSGTGDGKVVSRLTTNISENNKTLKELNNQVKSSDLRLSILESSLFTKTNNHFENYITSTSEKVFSIKLVQNRRGESDCDAITDTYVYLRTPNYNDNAVDIIETITRHDISGKVCFQRDVIKRKTPTKLLYISNQNKVYNEYPVNDIASYIEPVVLLTSTMEEGKSFGSGGIINYVSNGTTNTLVFNKVSTVLNSEAKLTLTVNQAEKTYRNCIIIGTRSNSTVSTEWYCPGDGLVKRVIFYPSIKNKPARSEIITLKSIAAY
ncbi:MAG: hypothetical protein ACC653_07745 [Gammaproteobacteria bacterium]